MNALQIALRILEAVNIIALAGLLLVALGFLTLPTLYLFQRRRAGEAGSTPRAVTDLAQLPDVLVQLPVFNEPQVVVGLLDAVAALDWPAAKLHIQLLDDSFDETTEIAAARIDALRLRGLRIEHVRRDDRDGFKAGALCAGLARSDAPFVAMLDADFRPPPEWLMVVVPRLMADPRAGFVQSRCEFVNADDNWLTRAQGLLLDSHFIMEQGVRARAGLLIQFNGTGGVWRRAAIEAAGGWSGDSLSEDLNLAVRAALAGWRGLFVADPAVPGLVPNQIRHWRVQQRRWSMGFAQNARTLSARIWRSDWSLAQRLSAEFLLFYQAALPLVVVALAASLVDGACGSPDAAIVVPLWLLAGPLVVTLAVGMTLPPYLDLRRGGFRRYVAALVAIPLLIVFLAFSNTAAVVTGFFGRDDIFHRTPKANAQEEG